MKTIRSSSMNCNLKLAQQRGVAAVEFALLIILLLIIVSGVVEFGRTFWYYDALTKATRDAARFLSNVRVSKDIALDSAHINEAETMVVNAATSARVPSTTGNYDVAITCDTACDVAPTYITVSVAYPVTIGGWIPIFVPTGTTTWSATLSPYTTMRYMK